MQKGNITGWYLQGSKSQITGHGSQGSISVRRGSKEHLEGCGSVLEEVEGIWDLATAQSIQTATSFKKSR